MPITVQHQPNLGLLAGASLAAGRSQYLDQRRREEAQRQLQLLQMAQQQSMQDQRVAAQLRSQQMSEAGDLSRFGLQRQAQLQDAATRHGNNLEYLQAQQQGQNQYLQARGQQDRQLYDLRMSQQAQQRERESLESRFDSYRQNPEAFDLLNPEGKAAYERVIKARQDIISDPKASPQMRQQALEKWVFPEMQKFLDMAPTRQRKIGTEEGDTVDFGPMKMRRNLKGDLEFAGYNFPEDDPTMQGFINKHKFQVDRGDGTMATIAMLPDGRGGLRPEVINPPNPQKELNELQQAQVEETKASVELRRIEAANKRIDAIGKIIEGAGKNLDTGSPNMSWDEASRIYQQMTGDEGPIARPTGDPQVGDTNFARQFLDDPVGTIQKLAGASEQATQPELKAALATTATLLPRLKQGGTLTTAERKMLMEAQAVIGRHREKPAPVMPRGWLPPF